MFSMDRRNKFIPLRPYPTISVIEFLVPIARFPINYRKCYKNTQTGLWIINFVLLCLWFEFWFLFNFIS